MAKHVRVDREWHLGGLDDALVEAMEANGAKRVSGGDGGSNSLLRANASRRTLSNDYTSLC